MDLYVQVDGGNDEAELRSLYNWLRRDDDLRGSHIDRAAPGPGPEDMGALSDAVVVSLGTGGVGVAVVQSLSTWLRTRGAHVRLKIRGPHGELDVDMERVRDPEALVARFQSILQG
jgi:hypothetical protein